VRFERLSYLQVLDRGLKVLDSTAVSLSMDNNIPIVVFNMETDGNIIRACTGEEVGTTVSNEPV
jgi:uridylate kinase